MVRSYTTFSPYIRQAAKAKGLSLQEAIALHAKLAREKDPTLGLMITYACCIEAQVIDGKALHIFLPDGEFCEWLVGCVPVLETKHALVVRAHVGDTVGVLHFPCSSRRSSVAFDIQRTVKDLAYGLCGEPAPENHNDEEDNPACVGMSWSVGNQDKLTFELMRLDAKNPNEPDSLVMWYAKLIVGLGMYMECFPESIRTGPPEDVKHPSHHKYSASISIQNSPRIYSNGTHDSPVAHFRKGHFRLLASPKFTKKRFQVVFVRETFVRGKSETVMSLSELDQSALDG